MIRVSISRLPNDPIAIRASIGGKPDIAYYCAYRGTKTEILRMLEVVTEAVRYSPENLEIENEIQIKHN